MRDRILLGSVALLLGAGAGAFPAVAYEGRYVAGGAGYDQALTMSRRDDGFRGKASVATRGCVGEFDGSGRVERGRLVLRARSEGRECRLTIRAEAGGVLHVSEDGCLAFHGAACEFSGRYRRGAR